MNQNTDTAGLPATSHQQAAAILKDQIMGFRNTQLIAVAAKLDIAMHLKDGPKPPELLASLTNTNTVALNRVMRALTSIGVFIENADGTFSNNHTSELLVDATPGSVRSIAALYGEPWLWHAYGQLMHSVQTGEQAFEHVHGKALYDYLQSHQNAADVFNKAMSAFSSIEANAINKAYNFSLKSVVVDVGGGEGTLVGTLVKANANLSGVVFDRIDYGSSQTSSQSNGKISYVTGNFFDGVPHGGDVYILKSVLHNWDDAACVRILKNCRRAMTQRSALLVIERVIPEGAEKSDAKLFDINMLVMVGGQERTESQYRKLFLESGFMLKRTISTQSSLSIVEAHPL